MFIQMNHNIRTHHVVQKFAGYTGQGNWVVIQARDLSAFLNRGGGGGAKLMLAKDYSQFGDFTRVY